MENINPLHCWRVIKCFSCIVGCVLLPFIFRLPTVFGETRITQTSQDREQQQQHVQIIPTSVQVWSDDIVAQYAETQKGKSDCGACAVYNAFAAFRYICEARNNHCVNNIAYHDVLNHMNVRIRDYETKDLFKYLYSRRHAGTIHIDLIDSVNRLSPDRLVCKFLPMTGEITPSRSRHLMHLIRHLMHHGCQAIATGSCQLSFHHQMIYACGEDTIGLTNPLSCENSHDFFQYVSSDPVLFIERHDVMRFFPEEPVQREAFVKSEEYRVMMEPLNSLPWSEYKVREQIEMMVQTDDINYIWIPWAGQCGLTFVAPKNSSAQTELEKLDPIRSFVEYVVKYEMKLPSSDESKQKIIIDAVLSLVRKNDIANDRRGWILLNELIRMMYNKCSSSTL